MSNNNKFLEDVDKLLDEKYSRLNQLRMVYDLHDLTIGKAAETLNTKVDKSMDDILIRLSLHALFTISALDLLSILSLHKKSSTPWENIFLIKSACLTIYESIKAFEKRKVYLRNYLVSKNIDITKFNDIGNQLRIYKRTFAFSQIEKIRNEAAGHINEDFKDYFDTLITMDIVNGVNAILKFLEILEMLESYLENIRVEINAMLEMELKELKKKTLNQLEELRIKLGI